jgi:uncharacterized protein (TIGR02996 family)
MIDESALLGAVLREPEADAPRLAYAEWLQQVGGASNNARAELIRIQIEIEQWSGAGRHWLELACRERELLARWAPSWERPFRDLLKPSLFRPARWLRARLFGQGGAWRIHRGFIEEIDTSASTFLEEDCILFGHAPIRRIVLSNATSLIGALSSDARLDHLVSLHLIADAEFDEEMEGLRQAAAATGLLVIEMRFPRIQSDAGELLALIGSEMDEDASKKEKLSEFRNWQRASQRERDRLRELANKPNLMRRLTDADHFSHAESLRLNDWIFLGNRLRDAGAWAVVKTFHDLEDEEGLCRRLVLFKQNQLNEDAFQDLRQSPHFHAEGSL